MKSNIPTMLSAPEFHADMIEAAREGNTLSPEDIRYAIHVCQIPTTRITTPSWKIYEEMWIAQMLDREFKSVGL
jgi:hypothetical protein